VSVKVRSHSFPTQLFELFTDDEGNLHSQPATDAAGNPVISREAVERRDPLIENLASLPPVNGALDQILHRFGADLDLFLHYDVAKFAADSLLGGEVDSNPRSRPEIPL
jgi:hypothetical protein